MGRKQRIRRPIYRKDNKVFRQCFFEFLAPNTVPFFHRPDYLENAMYGRTWMVSLILQLVSMKDVAVTPAENDAAASRVDVSQSLVKEQTEKLLSSFLLREQAAMKKGCSETDKALHEFSKTLVLDLLSGLDSMDKEHLRHLAWLNPSLLTWCTRSKEKSIQKAVHDLLEKTSPAASESGSGPGPEPFAGAEPTSAEPDSVSDGPEPASAGSEPTPFSESSSEV